MGTSDAAMAVSETETLSIIHYKTITNRIYFLNNQSHVPIVSLDELAGARHHHHIMPPVTLVTLAPYLTRKQ
jgi:hypothetical protein